VATSTHPRRTNAPGRTCYVDGSPRLPQHPPAGSTLLAHTTAWDPGRLGLIADRATLHKVSVTGATEQVSADRATNNTKGQQTTPLASHQVSSDHAMDASTSGGGRGMGRDRGGGVANGKKVSAQFLSVSLWLPLLTIWLHSNLSAPSREVDLNT
jgi:hypothetical protein